MADGNKFIQIAQPCFIFSQDDDMVTLYLITRSFFLSFYSFLIKLVLNFSTVADKITFHTKDKFQIATLCCIVTEGKSLHNTMVCNRQSFMSPFDGFLYQILHRGQAIHLTHLRMTMKLNAFNFCVILAFRNIYLHNAKRR